MTENGRFVFDGEGLPLRGQAGQQSKDNIAQQGGVP